MGEVVRLTIQGEECDVTLREYQGQRVVTFRQIDELHRRPENTASRTFSAHKQRFVEGVDFFWLSYEELNSTRYVELPSRNGLTLLTESGYLMIVKPMTDDLAWEVQRKLVNGYFRAKEQAAPASTLDALELMIRGMREQQERINRLEAAKEQQGAQLTNLGHRVANLDMTNIEGTPRQRLGAMIRLYAFQHSITYPTAWHRFDAAFNTAYRTNLTARRKRYAAANRLKEIDRPAYLEANGLIEDAIRVADKMLNGSGERTA